MYFYLSLGENSQKIKQLEMIDPEEINQQIEMYKGELKKEGQDKETYTALQEHKEGLEKELDEAEKRNAEVEQKIQKIKGEKASEKRRLIHSATKDASSEAWQYAFAQHLALTVVGRDGQKRLLPILFCQQRADILLPFLRTSAMLSQLQTLKQETLDAIAKPEAEDNASIIETPAKKLLSVITLGKPIFTEPIWIGGFGINQHRYDTASPDILDCMTFLSNKEQAKKITLTPEEKLSNDTFEAIEQSAALVHLTYHAPNPHVWRRMKETLEHQTGEPSEIAKEWAITIEAMLTKPAPTEKFRRLTMDNQKAGVYSNAEEQIKLRTAERKEVIRHDPDLKTFVDIMGYIQENRARFTRLDEHKVRGAVLMILKLWKNRTHIIGICNEVLANNPGVKIPEITLTGVEWDTGAIWHKPARYQEGLAVITEKARGVDPQIVLYHGFEQHFLHNTNVLSQLQKMINLWQKLRIDPEKVDFIKTLGDPGWVCMQGLQKDMLDFVMRHTAADYINLDFD